MKNKTIWPSIQKKNIPLPDTIDIHFVHVHLFTYITRKERKIKTKAINIKIKKILLVCFSFIKVFSHVFLYNRNHIIIPKDYKTRIRAESTLFSTHLFILPTQTHTNILHFEG